MADHDKHVYTCDNRRCTLYGREWRAPSPAAWRRFTGRALMCDQCGRTARYLRPDRPMAGAAPTDDDDHRDPNDCAECARSHGPHYRGRCPH